MRTGRRIAVACLLVSLGLVSTASALPFTLTTVLRGDPRPANPDNLEVLVTVLGDTTSNITNWTVDLNMALYHPNARLDEFGFNLWADPAGTAPHYTFGNFSLPYTATGGTLNGGGSVRFLLTMDDPSGHRYDATNATNLTFSVTRNTGVFSLNDFLGAPVSCSSDSFLGCNQLGAHLVALNGGSGVAIGNYPQPPPPPPPVGVPEPGSLMLLGLGVAGAAISRRR